MQRVKFIGLPSALAFGLAFAFALGAALPALAAAPSIPTPAAPPPAKAPATPPAPKVEPAPQHSAQKLLGDDVKGANWTVAPTVHSDGFLRLYEFETPYGKFQVNGQRRMTERLQELRALQALEKMSRTDAFGTAVKNAGLAPIRFGRDLIVDPVETTGNLISGVGKMFENIHASVAHRDVSRDPLFESVTGITKAERDLAFALKVDPYTDFTPLRKGLEDVAQVIAAGDLSVTAALSAIPGGAGVAVSGTATASTVANSVYSKTSIEIAGLVTSKLKALGVDDDTAKKFVLNTYYSPADQFAIAEALESLHAAHAGVFVAHAALATSADVAKFNRYRAELLERNSSKLGGLKDFMLVSDFALNLDATDRVVAAFPFDEVAWTDVVAPSLSKLSAAIDVRAPHVFATTGPVSPKAEAELKRLGWALVKLD